jgi:hypothetical protein
VRSCNHPAHTFFQGSHHIVSCLWCERSNMLPCSSAHILAILQPDQLRHCCCGAFIAQQQLLLTTHSSRSALCHLLQLLCAAALQLLCQSYCSAPF